MSKLIRSFIVPVPPELHDTNGDPVAIQMPAHSVILTGSLYYLGDIGISRRERGPAAFQAMCLPESSDVEVQLVWHQSGDLTNHSYRQYVGTIGPTGISLFIVKMGEVMTGQAFERFYRS
jgi:hypothetical protein